MKTDSSILSENSGRIVSNKVFRNIKTDYLKAMTKVYQKSQKETEKIRKKYQLTEEQMENIIKNI